MWNAALLRDLRSRCDPERLLYLFVDRELLARLHGGPPDEALADFCKAFQPVAQRPFARGFWSAQSWQSQDCLGDPPFVAHLALTVLAVTEDPVGAAHAVYPRQNLLLGRAPDSGEPEGYGEDVPGMWKVWNRWLVLPSTRLGLPSARTHEHWTRQGWARSQGIIRLSDRVMIERYLEALGMREEPQSLLDGLQQWLSYRGRAGESLLGTLADGAAAAVVEDVMHDEMRRYQAHGRRSRLAGARAQLVVDDWTGAVSGAISVTPDLVGTFVELGGEEYVIDAFDEFVSVPLPGDAASVLRDGVTVNLGLGRQARLGGDTCYVFRDEPRLGGRLQVLSATDWAPSHLLVHNSRATDVTDELRREGIPGKSRAAAVTGWTWLENVALRRDSRVLRFLGLAAGMPSQTDGTVLSGGLAVGARHYLVGGEPDVIVGGVVAPVMVDGRPLPASDGGVLALWDQALEPGPHVVGVGDARLTFTTSIWMRERAVGADLWRTATALGRGRYVFDDPRRGESAGLRLSGALLRETPVPEPLVVRRRDDEVLTLLEDGTLLELYPPSPRWLRVLNLRPGQLDVFHALRTTSPRPAFLLLHNKRTGSVRAVSVPVEGDLVRGATPSRPRPDLIGGLVTKPWRWLGPEATKRRSDTLTRALSQHGARAGEPPRVQASEGLRSDVVEHVLTNPYDEVLQWLSEQEKCWVPASKFATAWAWSCHKSGLPDVAMQWRLALKTLSRLGHVERDYRRQQVGVAAPALVSLPTAAGLSVLTGARPLRVLERLNDPDAGDATGLAASMWELHERTGLGADRVPLGPTAVFIEWDEAQRETVDRGLQDVGISRTGIAADRLLGMAPDVQSSLSAGAELLVSPGREPFLLSRAVSGWHWQQRHADSSPGLYRYRLPQGSLFAWRDAGGGLRQCAPAVGRWLAQSADGVRRLLVHQPVENTLLVAADTPLPDLIDRALTLRSGLPPFPVDGHQVDGRGVARDYLGYVNVDARTAEHVAHLCGQQLETDTSPLRTDP